MASRRFIAWLFWAIGLFVPIIHAADSLPIVSISTSTLPSEPVSVSSIPFVWRSLPNTAFSAGEECQFVIRWGLVTGGSSSLSVTGIETINGRPAYKIVSEATSHGMVEAFYKVRDYNAAWLDVQSLSTVRYEKRVREGKYKIDEAVVFDQEKQHFAENAFRIDKNKHRNREGQLPPFALDVLGSLYYVRTLPLVVGEAYTIDVYSSGKVWPLLVKVKAKQKVKVPAGTFQTILVEPVLREAGIFISKGKKLEVWLTDDERRMPVRMRSEVFIGHVSADLVSFKPTVEPPPGVLKSEK